MTTSAPPAASFKERRGLAFLGLSLLLHALVLLSLRLSDADGPTLALSLPERIELGIVEARAGEPGKSGAPPPSAPKDPEPRPPPKPVPRPVLPRATAAAVVVDGGVPEHASASPDDAPARATGEGAEGASTQAAGDGQSPLGGGMGLGFGAGGFGSGTGGPVGAVIGLHADLERVAKTSLVLETEPLLGLIPGWQEVLSGSGLDALDDFARVFVATPTLRRADLVVSARIKGDAGKIERAARSLASERVVAVLGRDQILIARPADVARVQVVARALAERHAKEPGIERADGPAALLAMYEDEAVALSVEGARSMLPAGADFLPLGLRLALHHIDEHYARLRIFGYYETATAAEAALDRIEALRPSTLEHSRVTYLGLRAAVEQATITQDGRTLTIDARLTLHQTRYLMRMVAKLLAPRG